MDRAEPNNDAELLLDQTAWVRGLARSLAIDASGADDVAQDAMLAALESRSHSGADAARLRTWLTGVVRNLSNLRVRGESRRRVREETVARAEPTPSVAETVSRASQLRLVVDAVMDLDEPHRSTILLRYFDGLSTQRVAETMDCSPEAVRKRLSRALSKLRERLDQKHGGDGSSWLTALAPFLGDLNPGALAGGATPAGLGAPGAGKLGVATWAAIGSVAAGTALVLGGGIAGDAASLPVPIEPSLADARVATLEPRSDEVRQPVALLRRSIAAKAGEAAAPNPGTGGDELALAHVPVPAEPVREVTRPVPSFGGQVFDLGARPVSGLDVFAIDGRDEYLATSGEEGRFEGHLTEPGALLAVRADEYATLRAARVSDLAVHAEPIVVVGPRVDLAGRVLAEDGRSLEGAELSLVTTESALHGFPYRLQNTVPIERRFRTRVDGSFELEDWVFGSGLFLKVECAGFEALSLPVPAFSDRELTLTLVESPMQLLHGVVFHQGGAPAVGARVELGPYETLADSDGLFRLEHRAVSPGTALCASSPGFVPGQIPSFGARLRSTEGAPLPVHLVLGGPARAIAGVIRDQAGRPAAEWDAFAVPVAARTDGEPNEAIAGAAGHSRTSRDGRFVLAGLAEGDYVVHAVDRRTLVTLRSDVVSSGGDSELQLVVPEVSMERVQGRIVGRDGAPLTGARVTVVLDSSQLGFDPGVESGFASGALE